MKKWKKLLVAGLVIPLIAFIVLETLSLLSFQRVEAVRRKLVAAGGSTKTEKRVPTWLQQLMGDKFHSFLDETILTELTLSGPEVGDAELALVAELVHLRLLDLNRSKITSDGLKHLSGLANIEFLDLTGTPVSDLKPIETLTSLERLSLEHSQVRDANLQSLEKLPNLRELNAGYLKLTDSGFTYVGNCSGLETLGLSGANLTDHGFQQIQGLKKLTVLVLRNAEFDDADFRKFKEALPGCTVHGL